MDPQKLGEMEAKLCQIYIIVMCQDKGSTVQVY